MAGPFLGSTNVFVPFDVFAPSGTDPFGIAEIFVQGYQCFPQSSVAASVDGLTEASAKGEMPLDCHFHVDPDEPSADEPPNVQGTAHVDLEWFGEGTVERHTLAGRYSSCVTQREFRHAVVTGQVRVEIEALGVDESAVTLADDDDSIGFDQTICRPER